MEKIIITIIHCDWSRKFKHVHKQSYAPIWQEGPVQPYPGVSAAQPLGQEPLFTLHVLLPAQWHFITHPSPYKQPNNSYTVQLEH